MYFLRERERERERERIKDKELRRHGIEKEYKGKDKGESEEKKIINKG